MVVSACSSERGRVRICSGRAKRALPLAMRQRHPVDWLGNTWPLISAATQAQAAGKAREPGERAAGLERAERVTEYLSARAATVARKS